MCSSPLSVWRHKAYTPFSISDETPSYIMCLSPALVSTHPSMSVSQEICLLLSYLVAREHSIEKSRYTEREERGRQAGRYSCLSLTIWVFCNLPVHVSERSFQQKGKALPLRRPHHQGTRRKRSGEEKRGVEEDVDAEGRFYHV